MSDLEQNLIAETDFAAMLSSRVCHDMANSILALTAGVDFLGDDSANDEMQKEGLNLLHSSIEKITARLHYARLAYGAMGATGAEVDLGTIREFLDGIAKFEKADFSWDIPPILIEKNKGKVILNLANIALTSLLRGGNVHIEVAQEPFIVRLTCTGKMIRLQDEVIECLKTPKEGNVTNVYTIQAIYINKLLAVIGAKLDIDLQEDKLIFLVHSV